MGVINGTSTEDERVIYEGTLHWAILLGPILVIIIGGLALRSQGQHAIVLITFGLIWGIFSYIALQRSVIRLTRYIPIIEIGFPLKKSCRIPISDIVMIDYYQPSLGSMLDFGKIIIIEKAKTRHVFRFVSSPMEFVKEVREHMIALQQSSTGSRTP